MKPGAGNIPVPDFFTGTLKLTDSKAHYAKRFIYSQ